MLKHTNELKSATVTVNGTTAVIRPSGGVYADIARHRTLMEEGATFLDAIEMYDPFHPENRT